MTPRHTHFPETPQQHRNYMAAPNLLQVVSGKKHLVNERQRARVSQVMTQDLLQHTNLLAPSGLPECHGFSRKAWPARPGPTHAHFRSVSHISCPRLASRRLLFLPLFQKLVPSDENDELLPISGVMSASCAY